MKNKGTNKLKFVYIILSIFLLGLWLRIHRLSQLPPGATLDEISIGYNAFTIRTEGKDQDGVHLPIGHFKSLGDYKLPLEIYLVSLTQMAAGNSIFAIRFPAALLGSLTILTTYLLTRYFFGSTVGLIASFLLSISPWHVFHSHLGLETNAGVFFSTLTLLLLLYSFKNIRYLFLTTIFFLITIYTHHSFWLFLPTLSSIWIFIQRKQLFFTKHKKIILACLFLFSIACFPLAAEKGFGNTARLNQSFLSPSRITDARNEARLLCNGNHQGCVNILMTKSIASHVVRQYMDAFSLIAWYTPTGFDLFDVMPNRGLFYVFEFFLLFVGIIAIAKNDTTRTKNLLFAWWFVYPLPIVATTTLSAARMYHLLPLPQIIEAYALYMIIKKNKIIMGLATLIITVSFLRFIVDFWYVYPFVYSRYVNYGYTAILNLTLKHPENIYYVEEPLFHPLYLQYFYGILPKNVSRKEENSSGRIVTKFKNVLIVERGYLPPDKEGNILISFREDIPKTFKEMGIISLKDGSTYAHISEFDK